MHTARVSSSQKPDMNRKIWAEKHQTEGGNFMYLNVKGCCSLGGALLLGYFLTQREGISRERASRTNRKQKLCHTHTHTAHKAPLGPKPPHHVETVEQ